MFLASPDSVVGFNHRTISAVSLAASPALNDKTVELPLRPPSVPARVAEIAAGLLTAPNAPWPDCDSAPAIPGYEIIGFLGRGGMGVVYKAFHEPLQRIVALKMISTGFRAKPDELARFRTETEAIAALQHPGIVQIYDVGEHDGRPYCALEYVAGGSLAERVTGQLQPAAAAHLVESLARAVHYAHERGIVHRDLKPGNILLSELPHQVSSDQTQSWPSATLATDFHLPAPKISDFGVAKRLEADACHTCTGDIVGTPSYMSPEQAASRKDVGPAADLYALGAILYKLLSGRPPFDGESPMEVLDQVRSADPVPLRQLRPNLPRDVETICLKCMAKEPQRRYDSAAGLADDLARFLEGRPILARPVGIIERAWRWSRRRPGVAALVLVLAVILCVGCTLVLSQWRKAEALAKENGQARERAEEYHRRAQVVVERLTQVGDELADRPYVDRTRAAALEEVLRYYQGFVDEGHGDRVARHDVARAALRAGIVRLQLGQFEAALSVLRQAGDLLDGLLAESPTDLGLRGERADCYLNIGHVFKSTARFAEALTPYQQSIVLREGLCVELSGSAEQVSKLAYVLANWSAVRRRSGPDESDVAGITLQRAVRVLRPILTADPDHPGHRQTMAIVLEELGRQHWVRRRVPAAETALRQATELYQQLVRERPDAQRRYYVARTKMRMARVLNGTDRPADAAALCQEAAVLSERIIAEFPGCSAYRSGLTSIFEEWRRALAVLNCRDQEKLVIRQALAHVERLAADFPDDPAHCTALIHWRVCLKACESTAISLPQERG
jgi:serine/threonine protein kinase